MRERKLAEDPFYVLTLRKELETRKKTNSKYSLRAFARFLSVDPAALCRIINGRQSLSIKSCHQVLNKLKLVGIEAELFLSSVLDRKTRDMVGEMTSSLNRDAGRAGSDKNRPPAIPRSLLHCTYVVKVSSISALCEQLKAVLESFRETDPDEESRSIRLSLSSVVP